MSEDAKQNIYFFASCFDMLLIYSCYWRWKNFGWPINQT